VTRPGVSPGSRLAAVAGPLIVEFAGPRGAGKSTLAQVLRNELDDRGVLGQPPPMRWPEKVRIWSVSVLPRLRMHTYVRSLRPPALDLRRFDAETKRYLYRMARVRRCEGVHVLGDGVCHLMLTVQEETAQKDVRTIWDALSGRMPLPDVVVFVDASDDDIAARRAERGNEGDRLVPRFRESDRDARDQLVSILMGLGAGPVVMRIENREREALSRVARELAEAVVGVEGRTRPVAADTLGVDAPMKREA
jgi:thymidylate kinase